MNTAELRQKRAKLIADQRALLDAAPDGLSSDDSATYDAIETDVRALEVQIERAETTENRMRDLASASGSEIVRPAGADAGEGRANPLDTPEYREAFDRFIRTGNTRDLRAMQIGTPSEGGYLAPTEFEKSILDLLPAYNVARGFATVISTQNDRDIPVVSSHGSAAWTAEEGAFNDSDDVFGQLSIKAHKATRIVKVSEELLSDAGFNVEAYLSKEFARSLGALEEAAFIVGTGTTHPTGICTGGTSLSAFASATAVTSDELIDVQTGLPTQYAANASWLFDPTTFGAVRKLKSTTGGDYLLQAGLRAGEPDMLLGKPVHQSSNMAGMTASAKSIVYGDLSYYWIADRGNMVFQRLNELYAANGQVGFRTFKRVDGLLTLGEAVVYGVQHA